MERTGRFDGDTWDLASSVGATATGVAAARALASRGPNPLIDDPFAEPLVKAVGAEIFSKMLSGEIDLDEWVQSSPRYLLRNNFAGVPDATIGRMK